MQKLRKIEVVPYDPSWPQQYAAEAELLRDTLGRNLIAIHHIGSTSIPGMSAKPILDMMPIVQELDKLEPALTALGYTYWGENGIPGRRYFTKGPNDARTHNVHSFCLDNPEVSDRLNFRDYLTAHPGEAKAYILIKKKLARQFPTDIDRYVAGKHDFIQDIIHKARQWCGKER